MDIVSLKQPEFHSIINEDIDLVICASGYETRSGHLARRLKGCNKAQLLCFAFDENRDNCARENNDKKYKSLGYEEKIILGHSSKVVEDIFESFLNSYESKRCKIIVDVSSMTRAWYGAIVRVLKNNMTMDNVTVYFTYVPAAYYRPTPPYPPNEIVSPVRGFSGLCLPDKPVALIIGLGRDYGRAVGIKEELDPDLVLTFSDKPSTNMQFVKDVYTANFDLLDKTPSENQFYYPLTDSTLLYQLLDSVCVGIQRNYRVVLVSIGPKLFGLCCFLIATKYPQVSVWRISAGTKGEIIDVKPSKSVVTMEVEWRSAREKNELYPLVANR